MPSHGLLRLLLLYITLIVTSHCVYCQSALPEKTETADSATSPATTILKEVAVFAPPFQLTQKEGRLVLDLKNSPTSAGSSVLDILTRMPAVTVNIQAGTLSVKGKEGAIVLINGKRNYMPPSGLFQLLAGLNAENIDKIEIITTPSADMDAEGKAGIINIILKKGKHEGRYGSLGAQAGYGAGTLAGLNGDLTWMQGKWDLTANYSFSRNAQKQISFNDRQNFWQGADFSSATLSERTPVQANHNVYIDAGCQLTKATALHGSLSFYDNRWSMNALNHTTQSLGQAQSGFETPNNEVNHWTHYGGTLAYDHTFRNKGILSSSVDYLSYRDNNPANYQSATRTTKSTPISIFVGEADYNIPPSTRWTFRIGLKTSLSHLTNNVTVTSFEQGAWVPDTSLSSASSLQENIFAGYGEAACKVSETSRLKLGLRYEYTDHRLQLNGHTEDRYGHFFPSLSFDHKLGGNSAITFAYARRINRPAFTDIAPFVLFIDPHTLFSGNPAVHPSVSDNISLDYTLGRLVLSTSFTSEKSALEKFQISVDSSTNLQELKPENMADLKTLNITLIAPLTLCSFWDMQVAVSGLWQDEHTGPALGAQHRTQWSYQLSGSETFKIPARFILELSGFYNSAMLSGASHLQSVGGLNAALKKSFGKSSLVLNYTDILNTIKYTSLVDGPGLFIRNGFDFSHPTVKITYAYKFGSPGPRPKTKRDNSADDERRRVE